MELSWEVLRGLPLLFRLRSGSGFKAATVFIVAAIDEGFVALKHENATHYITIKIWMRAKSEFALICQCGTIDFYSDFSGRVRICLIGLIQ